jgi:hypothetical protein
MKTNPQNKKKKAALPGQDKKSFLKTPAILLFPSGTKFNDIYMDASDVAIELKISKRLVRNMRASGKLSYTNPFGKIWYFRQEIAEILEGNKKPRKI